MIFSLFNPWPVYGVPQNGEWPISPRLSEPDATTQGMQRGIEISKVADRVGFDYVTVAEHHYHPRQLSPNPILSGAALAQHMTQAGVAVLGANLPMVNPLRAAEELAVLDAMTNGKLLVGLFRGTPTEYLSYGTNPAETREVFEEAVSLMIQAWTQPEPFSWVGRHYDFRLVSVWPRPVSIPHPPILVSANSPASATYAAEQRFKIGVAFSPVERATALISLFKSEAERFGWTPEPEDILYRGFCTVAETDEQAEELVARHHFGDMTKVFMSNNRVIMTELRQALGGAGGGPPSAPPTASRPFFMGSPDTVTRQIREFAEQSGAGHFDLVFNDVVMPFDDAVRGVELFGQEVLPRLVAEPVSA